MEPLKVFWEFVNLLRERSKMVPVIVEGKNDEKLLKRFGVKNIYTLSGKNYFDLVEGLPEDAEEVILLTDVDPHGERIFKKLSGVLSKYGIKVDGSFREYLKRLGVEEVEHLGEIFFNLPPKG